jgi:hypothetical protein
MRSSVALSRNFRRALPLLAFALACGGSRKPVDAPQGTPEGPSPDDEPKPTAEPTGEVYPCRVTPTAARGAPNGDTSDLPPCKGVVWPKEKDECAELGWLFLPSKALCVETCPAPRKKTRENECCEVGADGKCKTPDPSVSGPDPCPSGMDQVCDSWGECHCSAAVR